MKDELNRQFAEAWTQAVMEGNRTRHPQNLWMHQGKFAWGPNLPSDLDVGAYRELDREEYQEQLKLKGADENLERAVYNEAMIVAPYWVDWLSDPQWVRSANVDGFDPEKFHATEVPAARPVLPREITPELCRNFAETYASAVVEQTKSRMSHCVGFDPDLGQFVAKLVPYHWDVETTFTVAAASSSSLNAFGSIAFGDGLQLDPRHPDFNETALRADVYAAVSGDDHLAEMAFEAIYPAVIRDHYFPLPGSDGNAEPALPGPVA